MLVIFALALLILYAPSYPLSGRNFRESGIVFNLSSLDGTFVKKKEKKKSFNKA